MAIYFLRAYLDNNIGDDLMIELLTSANKDSTFYIKSSNFDILGYKNRFSNVKKLPKNILQQILLSFQYDAFITIGGSMFIQPIQSKKKPILSFIRGFTRFLKVLITNIFFQLTGKKVFIIGCNVGPIKTNWFRTMLKFIFETSTHSTVRDKDSYETLLSLSIDPKQITLAPDLVHQFSHIPSNVKIINNTKIGISIIDLKNDAMNENYITFLVSIITTMNNSNSNVSFYIYSFDTGLEDDRVISRTLMAKIDPKIHVESIAYTGDIQAFTSLFASMDYMLCSRFHSIVLAINFNIPFLPLSYSTKTNNYLNSIDYKGAIIDAKSINKNTLAQYCDSGTYFSSFSTYSQPNKLVSESKKHLECWRD